MSSVHLLSVGYDQRLSVWRITSLPSSRNDEDSSHPISKMDFKLEWKFGTISIVGDVGGMALCQDDGFTQRYKVAVVGEGTQMYDVDIPEWFFWCK